MHKVSGRLVASVLTATVVAVLLGAGAASAHIDPSPPAVEAGTLATVEFGVEHGCSGSPTVALDIEVPVEITDAAPVTKSGWDSTINGRVITFSGGPLAADTPDSFAISFTAPGTPGTLLFPTVQKCVDGETSWISVTKPGEPEPEHPAPALKVTAGPPTSDELAPPEDDAAATSATVVTVTTAADASSDGGGSVGVVIGVLIVLVVVGGGGYLVVRSRSSDS
jgi:uncharacterized protein YcnI